MLKNNIKENKIQKAILEYLNLQKIFAWRNHTQGIIRRWEYRHGIKVPVSGKNPAKGCPDILGVLPEGYLLAIECKAPGGRVEPHQQSFMDNLRENGACVFVACSVEDVMQGLSEFYFHRNKMGETT